MELQIITAYTTKAEQITAYTLKAEQVSLELQIITQWSCIWWNCICTCSFFFFYWIEHFQIFLMYFIIILYLNNRLSTLFSSLASAQVDSNSLECQDPHWTMPNPSKYDVVKNNTRGGSIWYVVKDYLTWVNTFGSGCIWIRRSDKII